MQQPQEKRSAGMIIQSSHKIVCLISFLATNRPHTPINETHIIATQTWTSWGPLLVLGSDGPGSKMRDILLD